MELSGSAFAPAKIVGNLSSGWIDRMGIIRALREKVALINKSCYNLNDLKESS